MTEDGPPEELEERDGPLRSLRRSTRGRISLIWTIPILAVLLGASLVARTYLAKGPSIEIEFPVAAGLKAGATPVKYLDVEVGLVKEVRLKSSLDAVVALVELDPNAEEYLHQGTVFWLVRPRVSLAGISGIETLLSGQYIEVIPSHEGPRQTKFEGRLNPPIGARYPNGKTIVLETNRLGSIAQGTPVYHRGLRAGEVEHYELGQSEEPIRIYLVIDEEFAGRVRESSLFWNASGVEAHLGLGGVDIRTEGLAAVLAAGIAFSSDGSSAGEESAIAASGSSFVLHPGAEAALREQQRSESLSVLLESRTGKGLGAGTPIYYRGLEIGEIGKSWLTADAQAVRSRAFILPRFRPLVREGSRFYKSSGIDVSVDLDGIRVRSEALMAVAKGGVSIAVPERASDAAERDALFALYDEPEEAWLAWNPKIALDPALGAGGLGETEGVPELEHRLPATRDSGALEVILIADEMGSLSDSSRITYRSLPIGRVVAHSLSDDDSSVELRVRIGAAHRHLVGDDTRFWRSPGLSVDVGLDGLELEVGSLRTLAVGGITLDNPIGPGERARRRDRFALHPSKKLALADLHESEYLRISVEAPDSSLRPGAPVYFRKYEIGEVAGSMLTADARAVRVEIRVAREFAPLVRTNTRFWSPDAVSVDASLAGVEIDAAPLQAMLAGGVMIATPTEAEEEAAEGSVFRLEPRAPAGWKHWQPNLPLPGGQAAAFADATGKPTGLQVVLVANEVESIGEGDPIFYRGLQIGAVGAPHLGSDGTEVLLDALIAPEYASVIRQDTQFWNASGVEINLGWGGLETQTGPLETLLRGGIQAATPDPPGPRAEPADRFVLREQPDEGWQSWEPVLR